jgi:hypothetical protein
VALTAKRKPPSLPETAHLLAAAFENAWKSLTARGDRFGDPLKAAHSREVLAKRILELTQRGERDSIHLCDGAELIDDIDAI